MIISIVTLITLLISGNAEAFFITNFEKGVKEYVIEKDRKKEILSEAKTMTKFIKEYNKSRGKKLKEFKTIYESYTTGKEDLDLFFNDLTEEQMKFQDQFIDGRLDLTKLLTEDEWGHIIEYSEQSLDKTREKQEKKAKKSEKSNKSPKVLFEKTQNKVSKEIIDQDKAGRIIGSLDRLLGSYAKLIEQVAIVNVKDNDVLKKQNPEKEEFGLIYQEIDESRALVQKALIAFHEAVRENADSSSGEKVLKTLTKDLELTVH